MKALVVTEFQKPMQVLEMPDPTVPGDGIILRVEANGICRSDWHLWNGDWSWVGLDLELPHVMGHEYAGVVEAVGRDVRKFHVGDRVVVPFGLGDGTCEQCVAGHSNVCDNLLQSGVDFWGGYGRYAAIPRADFNVVPVPDNLDFESVAGLGCRYVTAFHGVVDQAHVQPGEWVAVHGCGGIGLSAIQIASAMGANVLAVDVNDDALALAKDLGAVATINARATDAAEEIKEFTKGGAHVSVDALGIPATCQNSVNSLRKRGRHLQIGLTGAEEAGQIALPIDVIVQKELSIIGSLGMQASRFPSLLRMMERGILQPGKLVTRRIGVEDASESIISMGGFSSVGITVLNRW